jgi:hypothetical protein
MTALATQFDLAALALAVFAAVLSPFASFLDDAFTGGMGAFRRICHRTPPARVTLRLLSVDWPEKTAGD